MLTILVLIGAALLAGQEAKADGVLRLGGGAHYWKTVKNIDVDKIEESGMAYFASLQLKLPAIFKVGVDVELLPDDFAGSKKESYAPQAYVVVGSAIYAALGIGKYYVDSAWWDDPFYNIRAGFDFDILPGVYLDIHGNYRFIEWDKIKDVDKDVDTDTVTLGAALRIEL